MPDMLPWPAIAAVSLLRVLMALAFLLVVLPYGLFPYRPRRDADAHPWVERALWMVFCSTAAVHVLAALRLYEGPVFLALCAATALAAWVRVLGVRGLRWIGLSAAGWVLDLMDGRPYWPGRRRVPPPAPPAGESRARRRTDALAAGVLALVFAVAAWMRYHQGFSTPALVFSDAPVNLAWTKYLEGAGPDPTAAARGPEGLRLHLRRFIYHDAIYPRGWYALVSLVRKFTALDAVHVLVVLGPLSSLAIVAGLGWVTWQATRSLPAATVAVLIYGTLPGLLPMDFDRQAAYNTQEYGLVFVLPAVWYVYRYLRSGRPADLWTAAAAAGMAPFTHPVPTLFFLAAAAAAGGTVLLSEGREAWRRLPALLAAVGATALIAVAPMAAAAALGQHWHSTSADFLQRERETPPPPPPPVYGAVLALAAVTAVAGTAAARAGRRRGADSGWAARAAATAVVAAALGVYFLPHLGVNLEWLVTRSGEAAALGLALAGGLGWHLLELALGRRRPAAALLLPALVAAAWFRYPPAPARPYPYYTHGQVMAYLWADRHWQPGTWTLVTGHTGYALALGRAFHQYPRDFLEMVGRLPPDPDRWPAAGRNLGYTLTPRYLLVVEKAVPLPPPPDPAPARPRLQDGELMRSWIEQNRDRLPLQHLYEGPEASIWTLTLPPDPAAGGLRGGGPPPGPQGG